MRKRFWSIPAVLIIAFGIFLLVAYWFSEHDQLVHYRSMCQSNLKQIDLVIHMYSQDYDQKLPPAIIEGKTVGWVEALSPYTESMQIFQCPFVKNDWQPNPNLPGFTDYWINRNLSGRNLAELDNQQQIILSGDGDGDSPASTASYTIDHLPQSWIQLLDSPAKRHHGSANYAFLDGHVKWYKPEEISQSPTSQREAVHTFLVK